MNIWKILLAVMHATIKKKHEERLMDAELGTEKMGQSQRTSGI